MTIDTKVRNWLLKKPGCIEGDSGDEVLRAAWAQCGVECGVHDFAQALWRAGYSPIPVRQKFRLQLPARPFQKMNHFANRRDQTRDLKTGLG